jgi:[acyl-carrier-protein] S-malonyltransferase
MNLAYVFDGLADKIGMGAELYERFAAARKCYEEFQEWTGLSAREIFTEPVIPRSGGFLGSISRIRQTAAVFAVCDVLDDFGIKPSGACGMSTGGLVAACVAGAVERRDLAMLLLRLRSAPRRPAGAPREGIAQLTIPAGKNVAEYLREGLYLVADAGPDPEGEGRLVTLGGVRPVLDELIAELPQDSVQSISKIPLAVHTPMQSHVRDYLEPYVVRMLVKDPVMPLWTCLDPNLLTAAPQVRGLLLRNMTEPLHVEYLKTGFREREYGLSLIIGPTTRLVRRQRLPVPAVCVQTPEEVEEAFAKICKLDSGELSMSEIGGMLS